MIILLKNLKFFFIHHRYTTFFLLLIKNIYNLKFFLAFFKKSQIYSLGNFQAYLNPFIYEELLLINDTKNNDIDYIQSFRNFLKKNTEFYLFNAKSNILYLFLSKTLNVKTYNYGLKKIIYNKNLTNFKNKNNFYKSLAKNPGRKILITDDINNLLVDLHKDRINNFDYIFTNSQIRKRINFKYCYKYDIYGKINDINSKVITKYYLYSNKQLISKVKNNSITAISLLKNLDIYPFDICYESVLPFVKKMIIAIDKSCFNLQYQKILNTFLKQTRFRNKIEIKYFNFNSLSSSQCHIKARWIADVNNKLCNYVSSKYFCYVQADEIFEFSLKKDFKKIVREDRDELNVNFLHFIYNFNLIRNPKFAAYNNFGRVYKKNLFVSDHDGCGFKKNDNRRSNVIFSKCSVFHIGYVYNYKKKILKNISSRNSIFRSSSREFYQNLKLIKINKDDKERFLNTINRYKYLDGYKNLKNKFDVK